MSKVFNDDDPPQERITRIIDAKLPLSWLLGAAATIITSYALLYSNVERLLRDIQELQISVKAGNSQAATLQGQIAILQFRVESLEAERKRSERAAPDVPARNGR